jgi:hypothetical protein
VIGPGTTLGPGRVYRVPKWFAGALTLVVFELGEAAGGTLLRAVGARGRVGRALGRLKAALER